MPHSESHSEGKGRSRFRDFLAACCVLAAASLHYHYFSTFVSGVTGPYSGRRLFVAGLYTWSEVGLQTRLLLWHFSLSALLPTLLFVAAYRLVSRGRAETAKRELSTARVAPMSVLFAGLVAAWGQKIFCYQPVTVDEFCHLFESRVLRLGHWSTTALGPADYLTSPFVKSNPWMGSYPPGWSVFLALFPDGLTWLGPPLMSALALLSLYALARTVADKSTADLSVLLVAFSPGYYWQGSTYFPHHAHLALLCAGLCLGIWAQRRQSLYLALLGGLALSWALLVRPIETLLFAGVWVLWWVIFRQTLGGHWKVLAVQGAAFAVGSLVLGSYLRHLGSFYLDLQAGPPLHFVAAVWNFCFSSLRTLAWWSPGFLLLLLYRLKVGNLRPLEWLLLMHAAATALAFALFIDNGQVEYGSRYQMAAWAMLCPLVGHGLLKLSRRVERPRWQLAALILVAYGCLPLGLLEHEAQGRISWPVVVGRRYFPPDAVVFVRATPAQNPTELIRNFPGGRQNWVYFLEPARNKALRKLWKDRPVYVMDWQGPKPVFRPFEHCDVDDSLSVMLAANNLATYLHRRRQGIDLWLSIPPGDPYFAGARLNAGLAYFKLGENRKGLQQFELAREAGVPEETINGLLRQNRIAKK